MAKLLFRVSEDPGVEPLLVKVPGNWVSEHSGDFELVGGGVYIMVRNEGFWAYQYARYVLRGPWVEMEDMIKKNKLWAYNYAHNILGLDSCEAGRWSNG